MRQLGRRRQWCGTSFVGISTAATAIDIASLLGPAAAAKSALLRCALTALGERHWVLVGWWV